MSNILASYRALLPVLKSVCAGEYEVFEFGGQGSGIKIRRKEILDATRMILSGTVDLVLLEDLGRAYREPANAMNFVYLCHYQGHARVISPNDTLDTYHHNWANQLFQAAPRHGSHVVDTAHRVRRTATDSFALGGMVIHVPLGYRKLTKEEAAQRVDDLKDLRIERIDDFAKTYENMVSLIVDHHQSLEAVARWMNAEGIPTPERIRGKKWRGRHLAALFRHPILYGLRIYRNETHELILNTGDHAVRPNADRLETLVPQLAHISKARFDELQVVLEARANTTKTGGNGDAPTRKGVARSDTTFLRQQTFCWICKQLCYDAASCSMRCKGSLADADFPCWNHTQFRVDLVHQLFADWLLLRLKEKSAVYEAFLENAFDVFSRMQADKGNERDGIVQRIDKLVKDQINLIESIKEAQSSKALLIKELDDLTIELESERKGLVDCDARMADAGYKDDLPSFAIDPRRELLHMMKHSYDFGALMRRLIPRIELQPIQAINSPQVRPRLFVQVNWLAFSLTAEETTDVQHLVVDGFIEKQLFRDRQVVADAYTASIAAGEPSGGAAVGRKLGIGKMRATRALKLQKMMIDAGLKEPYRVVTSPPCASRWHSHKK